MDIQTFVSGLKSNFAIYIVSNSIRNHPAEFEIEKTILTFLN